MSNSINFTTPAYIEAVEEEVTLVFRSAIEAAYFVTWLQKRKLPHQRYNRNASRLRSRRAINEPKVERAVEPMVEPVG